MGLPGRTPLARSLLLAALLVAVVLVGVPAAPPATAGAVDHRRTPPPGSATLPVRGPIPAGADASVPGFGPRAGASVPGFGPRADAFGTRDDDAFVPGRVLVGFEAGAGTPSQEAAVAAVGGRVVGRTGRARVVRLGRGGDARAAARRLAARPGVAYAEPDWVRQLDACAPNVCWHLQPNQGGTHGADVVAAHDHGATGSGQTVAVVDTGVATGVADLAGQVTARWRCRATCVELDPDQPDTRQDPQDPTTH